jgi:hypothetical protein
MLGGQSRRRASSRPGSFGGTFFSAIAAQHPII